MAGGTEQPDWFAGEIALDYDLDTADLSVPEVLGPQLDLLQELAAGGPVLEFAIGTGRVALPLAARGLRVSGIDVSADMVAQLRTKPGGDAASIPVIVGDMTTERMPDAGAYRLVYLVFDSLMNVTSQEGQVATFANAATHLADGGRFLVQMSVPALQRVPPGERYLVFDRTEDHVGIDEYDIATQRMWSHHISFRPDGRVRRTSPPFRYAWPAELDLMARLAGMRLEHRWADWDRTHFGNDSTQHISVWIR